LPRLAVLSVLSAASSPCPDLNLIHYTSEPKSSVKKQKGRLKTRLPMFQTTFHIKHTHSKEYL